MSVAEALSPRSPLNAKLDAKSFVQLTVWVLVVLAAWALGKYLLESGKTKAQQMLGKTTASGTSNPFFG